MTSPHPHPLSSRLDRCRHGLTQCLPPRPQQRRTEPANATHQADRGDSVPLPPRHVHPGFPRKLWMLVENNLVKSVTWGVSGRYVAIDEEMFVKEILKMAPPRLFITKRMRSIYRELNL
ncbi:hypothetical protein J4Q44_G00057840 [Coregonus suidteri]|uniref:HSF-type DNA-binding domain-containing protein n=1 Tax=Coregonus suidteri TaxID=861788 RepID=A0AAN8M2D5_9TELE